MSYDDDEQISQHFEKVGWRVLRDEPPGLIGGRKLVKDLKSGEELQADVVKLSEGERTRALCLNAQSFGLRDQSYAVSGFERGYFAEEWFYQVLPMWHEDRTLAATPREEFAATPQQGVVTAMRVLKSLEYLYLECCCHLAVSPWTVYRNHRDTRMGELWFVRRHSGAPLKPLWELYDLIPEAIPVYVQPYCAPEVIVDRDRVGTHSDAYSFALLLLYIMSGYSPDGSIECAADRALAIRQFDPIFDKEIADALARVLEPDVGKRSERLTGFGLLGPLCKFAQRLGATPPENYHDKPGDPRDPKNWVNVTP